MSKEKQIEEMAITTCSLYRAYFDKQCAGNSECDFNCHHYDRCEKLYEKGYRKQEWISVDERLPERNGRYLTHCDIEGQSLVCILHYCKVGGFNDGTVTHWMPLPEAPKKGGAE